MLVFRARIWRDKNFVVSIGEIAVKQKKLLPVNWETILAGITGGNTAVEYSPKHKIFWQGQPSDSVFYIRQGKVKLAVTSKQGKEAIVAVLSAGDFLGEGCLAGQPLRIATATAMSDCTLIRVERLMMTRIDFFDSMKRV